jgi:hypothetical protein
MNQKNKTNRKDQTNEKAQDSNPEPWLCDNPTNPMNSINPTTKVF